MEYSALRRNELMIHLRTWTHLQIILLIEEDNHKRAHIILFHLYKMSIIGKTIDTAVE